MKQAILIVREFDKFSEILAEADFETINFPAIRTLPVENLDELDEKLDKINKFDGLFFTSPKAAEVFLSRFREKNFDFHGKVYVLGDRTKRLFENTDFETVFRENANTAEEFINSFEKSEFAGKTFLFLRGDKSLRAIPEILKNIATIEESIVYRTEKIAVEIDEINQLREKFEAGEIAAACFFSPSAAESFLEQFGAEIAHQIVIATIGKTTAEYFERQSVKVGFVSSKSNAEKFAIELIEYLRENLPTKYTKGTKKE